MTLKNFTEENGIEWGWWVKIVTAFTDRTYYFGPFGIKQEVEFA